MDMSNTMFNNRMSGSQDILATFVVGKTVSDTNYSYSELHKLNHEQIVFVT